jgi:hypothetical protein
MASSVRRRAPSEIRGFVERDERVIAWTHDIHGRNLALTVQAAYLPHPDGPGLDRFGYETIVSVNWTDPILEVVVGARAEDRLRFDLEEPGDIPPVLRERVTATILLSARLMLGETPDGDRLRVGGAAETAPTGPGARITARRDPRDAERDGEARVAWQVVFDPGLDPGDPGLRQRADAAIAELKASSGL